MCSAPFPGQNVKGQSQSDHSKFLQYLLRGPVLF